MIKSVHWLLLAALASRSRTLLVAGEAKPAFCQPDAALVDVVAFGNNWASDGGIDLDDCIAQLSTSKWENRGAQSVTYRSGAYLGLKGNRCWFYSSDTLADAETCVGGASYSLADEPEPTPDPDHTPDPEPLDGECFPDSLWVMRSSGATEAAYVSDPGATLAQCKTDLAKSKWQNRGATATTFREGTHLGQKGPRCWFYAAAAMSQAEACDDGASYFVGSDSDGDGNGDGDGGGDEDGDGDGDGDGGNQRPGSETATCPRDGTPDISAADPPDSLTITKTVPIQNYVDFGLCSAGETCKVDFNYDKLNNGGQFCIQEGADVIDVVSTVHFRTNDECRTPPVSANGASCCEVKVWQPAANGLYYDDCSMTLDIGGSGELAWTTDMPGDEAAAFLNASDSLPHIHYEIKCSGCQKDSFYSSNSGTWDLQHDASKMWLGQVSNAPRYTGTASDAHLARFEGGKWVYQMVVDF